MKTYITNWPIKPLSDCLVSLESGGRPRGGGTLKGEIPSIGGEHLNGEGKFNFDSIKYIPLDYYQGMNQGKIEISDILIVKDGATTGKTSFVRSDFPFQDAAVNEHVFIVRTKPEILDSQFTFFFLYSENGKAQILTDFRGSAQGGITREFVNRVHLPVPPVPIQKKIAAILEKADAAREKRREASRLTGEFLRSAFLEMFGNPARNPKGWPTGMIADAIRRSEYGTSEKSNDVKRGFPILGMGNVTYDGQLDLDNLSYVELPKGEFERLKLRRGDVIFNRTNSTELVGKTTYWDRDFDAVIASYLVKLQLTKDFNPLWFSCLLNASYFKTLFRQRCRKAVGQSNISPTLLKEFPIYIPNISKQNKFVALVEKVESLRAKQRESERELDNIFNSLMQRAFRGEMVS
jgi:type I restriction enzyme S subunit